MDDDGHTGFGRSGKPRGLLATRDKLRTNPGVKKVAVLNHRLLDISSAGRRTDEMSGARPAWVTAA